MMMFFASALGFLKRVPWWAYAAIAVAGLWAWERDRHADNREADTRAEMQVQVDAERNAHAATKRAYREAQEEAARMQAEVIAAEIARQEGITANVRKDYQQRLAALRARADRLRDDARTGAGVGGASGEVRMPAESEATGRADAAPDCQRFPAPDLETDLACREIATAQAIQLDALITWVQQQTGD